MSVTIYHNPDCGTSRNTLAMIRNAGIEPTIIEYLKTPPTRERLIELIGRSGLSVREALRQKGTPYAELGLDDSLLSDDDLLDAMLKHPLLINRPFVETPHGYACAGRPRSFSISCLRPGACRSRKRTAKWLLTSTDAERSKVGGLHNPRYGAGVAPVSLCISTAEGRTACKMRRKDGTAAKSSSFSTRRS